MRTLFDEFRLWLGYKLIGLGLTSLPADAWEREGLLRGYKDAREYERYVGYTRALKGEVYPFDRWHEIRSTFALRAGLRGLQRAS